MLEVVVKGLVTGLAIAVPVGAIAAFLVTLTARTSWRVGAAGALGIATVDGLYATLAVVAGAALTLAHAVRGAEPRRDARPMQPWAAYLLFLGITAVNPATVVYFAAIVLGNRDLVSSAAQGAVFVAAAFAASAGWQLVLATGGAALGRFVTGPRGVGSPA